MKTKQFLSLLIPLDATPQKSRLNAEDIQFSRACKSDTTFTSSRWSPNSEVLVMGPPAGNGGMSPHKLFCASQDRGTVTWKSNSSQSLGSDLQRLI